MSIDVYLISGSAPAWRVLMLLETKQLNYQSHVLENANKDQKQPWFLALNPRGQVPVLKDADVVVSESLAILHYLEKKYPHPSLFGETAKQTAAIEQAIHEILAYTDKAVGRFVQPVFRNKVEQLSDVESIGEAIHAELSILENRLNSQDWLSSEQISAADIVLTPTIQRLLRAVGKAPQFAKTLALDSLAESYPGLDAWNQRVQQLPAFSASFPPHWKDKPASK